MGIREKEILLNLLKDLRIKAGMTQSDLAGKLKLPQSFVSKYENGERRLDILELREICLALGTEMREFSELLEGALK